METHIGDGLGIMVDGVVLSIPIIQSRLETGGVIQGNFTQEEAELLAAQLNAGALPFPLILVSVEMLKTP